MRSPNRLALRLGLALLLASPTIARAATTVSPTHVTPRASGAAETSHAITDGDLCSLAPSCSLHGAMITTGATAGYFMILNAATDPGNGAVLPVKCIAVPANDSRGISPDPDTAWDFPKGIVLLFSTTGCFTETQSATAFFSWQ